MSRVYLLADFGKGPRVVKWWPKVWNDSWHGERRTNNSPLTFSEADLRCRIGSKVCGVIASSLPKWLVEANSVKAARRLVVRGAPTGVACYEDQSDPGVISDHPFGSHQEAWQAGFDYLGRIVDQVMPDGPCGPHCNCQGPGECEAAK